MQLSIFPLRLNLLPDGVLPLRVFEPRYLRMIAESAKRGMGLCLLGKAQDGGFSPLLAIGTRENPPSCALLTAGTTYSG